MSSTIFRSLYRMYNSLFHLGRRRPPSCVGPYILLKIFLSKTWCILSVFFFSLKCSLFHNSNLFGSCIIHILYTECAKIKKNNSSAKRLSVRKLFNSRRVSRTGYIARLGSKRCVCTGFWLESLKEFYCLGVDVRPV